MDTHDFTEQRQTLLQSIEHDQQEMRAAVEQLANAAGLNLDIGDRIRAWPLTWAIGALLFGAWLGRRSHTSEEFAKGRGR